MSNFSSEQTLYLLLLAHCFIGAMAAGIAWYKGRPLKLWLLLGLSCGTAALFVALLMKAKSQLDSDAVSD
jgi:hypothetical protein